MGFPEADVMGASCSPDCGPDRHRTCRDNYYYVPLVKLTRWVSGLLLSRIACNLR